MTVQNDTLIDDCTSCTSEDTSSTMAASMTTPLRTTENTDNVQPTGPLYTPIAVPEPFNATMEAKNTEKAKVEAEMAMEEASASALIHAACRFHEATLVTTNAFHQLYYRWACLTPSEVNYEANRKTIPTHLKTGADRETVLHHTTMMLYIVATAMKKLNKAASSMAAVAVRTRAQAVEQGILLPLSALQDKNVAAKFAAFTGGATGETLQTARTNLDNKGVEFCFFWPVKFGPDSHASKRCFPWSERVDDISNATSLASFASNATKKVADTEKAMAEAEAAAGNGESTETRKAAYGKEEAARAARRKVQHLVYSGLFQSISNAAETTSQAVSTASKIARWRRPWRSIRASLPWLPLVGPVFGTRTTTPGSEDDAILSQAHDACKQAVAAIKEARERMPPSHD